MTMQAETGSAASTGTSKGVSTFTRSFQKYNSAIVAFQAPNE
jgi:hypothetical protein